MTPKQEDNKSKSSNGNPAAAAGAAAAIATTNATATTSEHHNKKVPLVELTLQHITYAPLTKGAAAAAAKKKGTAAPRHSRTTVLHDVSTTIRPYTLTGWLGPSGSGKTSLLSVAADLVAPGDLTGPDSAVLVNGEQGRLPKRLVGVVWQDDLLLTNLTVRENVWYTARLKTPPSMDDDAVSAVVDDVLHELGLWQVRHSVVGNPLGANGLASTSRGVSGGERKRVAVANELVVRPSLLLLDEPTSGLDTTTAAALMETLRQLAGRGHSVAAVIHQPRTAIFTGLLQHVLLLSKGRVVYEGPPQWARAYLEACPTVTPLPPETGLPDWLLDVIVDDEKETAAAAAKEAGVPADDDGGGGALALHWKAGGTEFVQSKQQQQQQQHLASSSCETTAATTTTQQEKTASSALKNAQPPTPPPSLYRKNSLKELEMLPKYNSPFLTQLRLLTQRTFLQQRGERLTTTAIILQAAYLFFVRALSSVQ